MPAQALASQFLVTAAVQNVPPGIAENSVVHNRITASHVGVQKYHLMGQE